VAVGETTRRPSATSTLWSSNISIGSLMPRSAQVSRRRIVGSTTSISPVKERKQGLFERLSRLLASTHHSGRIGIWNHDTRTTPSRSWHALMNWRSVRRVAPTPSNSSESTQLICSPENRGKCVHLACCGSQACQQTVADTQMRVGEAYITLCPA
jgi:hypothetical protein